jgi:hypothetical protein
LSAPAVAPHENLNSATILKPLTTQPSQPLLEAFCREWQRRLRVQDWQVSIYFVRGSDIQGKAGQCYSQFSKKQAVIRLTELADADGWDYPYDIEKTIVHELLHLVMAGIDPESKKTGLELDMEEQAVDTLATALIALKRGYLPHIATGRRTIDIETKAGTI